MKNYKLAHIQDILTESCVDNTNIDNVCFAVSGANGNKFVVGKGKITSYPINSLYANQLAKDKGASLRILGLAGEKTVTGCTEYVFDDDSLSRLLDRALSFGYPLVIKPNSGSRGFGVQLVASEYELLKYITHNSVLNNVYRLEKPLKGSEYRLLVLNGRVEYSFLRVCTGSFAKNVSNGGGYSQYTESHSDSFHVYGQKIASVVGLGVFALDVFCDGDFVPENLVILEVNAEPGLTVPESESGSNVVRKILKASLLSL
jgi:glutathione synthase/RimK-type ligase-like ATP-grasp enzyme